MNRELIFTNKGENNGEFNLESRIFGERVGLIGKLFGCWHKNLSRPFSKGSVAYRSCIQCGSRVRFDTETLQTDKRFYYPPLPVGELSYQN